MDGAKTLEKTAVGVSIWLGGVGLLLLKAAAYWLSGSSLVKCSAFESLGDVVTGSIMAVTQWKVSDTRDADSYPVGKHRLEPIGILFFCAFMMSSMLTSAIEAVQGIFESVDVPETARSVVIRVFEDHPFLRGNVRSQEQLDDIIGTSAGDDDGGSIVEPVAIQLFFACALCKAICLFWCLHVASKSDSVIAKTLAIDHRNDTISNAAIASLMMFVAHMEVSSYAGTWLTKVDPAATLCLSLWIIKGWFDEALEQVKLLSNRRLEDDELGERITADVTAHLKDGPWELRAVHVYHAGGGCEAIVELCPRTAEATGIAATCAGVEDVVRRADDEGKLQIVHTTLRKDAVKQESQTDCSWVQNYPRQVGGDA